MAVPLGFADGLDAAGGFVLAVLGALVWRLRRGRATGGLALYALGTGLSTGLHNLFDVLVIRGTVVSAPLHAAVSVVLAVPALVGLALIATAFPSPLAAHERRLVPPALALGLLVGVLGLTPILVAGSPRLGPDRGDAAVDLVGIYSWGSMIVVLAASWALLALLALRFRRGAADPTWARSAAIASVALVLYPLTTGPFFAANPEPLFALHFLGTFLAALVVLVLWIRNSARSAAPRLARDVTLAIAAAGLAAMALSGAGTFGIARLLAVVILAYAILRLQMLGIDVQVRWTLSKTTVAGAFVAVFFVASEAAQQFFGDTLGSSYVGILAAGCLTFALAPLSRLADRLAAHAIPLPAGTGMRPDGVTAPQPEQAYRRALALALRQPALTHDDERELVLLAHDLGLPPARAFALRDELERTRPVIREDGA